MKAYNILKDCVIENHYYQCGTVYKDESPDIDKRYIRILLEHGFMKEIVEKPKTIWDLKDGDRYYFITTNADISENSWYDCHIDRRDMGNAFLTRDEAEKELARRKAKVILERDTKGFKPSKNNKPFYEVYVDVYDGRLDVEEWQTEYKYARKFSTLCFDNEKDAKKSIEVHKKEWKIYLGVEDA